MNTVEFMISELTNYFGPLSARQRNAIQMAFRWWAESSFLFYMLTGYAGACAFMLSRQNIPCIHIKVEM